MLRFKVRSNRWIELKDGSALPYFMLYRALLDVKLEHDGGVAHRKNGRRILVGDPISSYVVSFAAAPNIVYDSILALQQAQERIPGLEANEFAAIVEGSAVRLNDDGTDASPVEPGEYLDI